ncbi:pitrilysin family protein [Hydrogenovibrio sp. JE_KL2]|uniref:M16 family metallopeptidase n=1 Tax=Hydrogenovibrio sp. JE_KL2 TaxID=2651188 RepID=UPI00128D3598|nr:pitrilysin family protein [Hydrogenovibrio sp. JE_KL2]MPQ76618.1 insulinase family protein [Hydrogenovibrio sp. JE_KL2]
MKLAIHWMFLGILAVTSFAAMAKSDAGIFEYQLKNGLKVVIKPDHRAPVVVQQVWYRVGSNYEENGLTGISHMLEHMMFKGTKTLKPGEFSERVAKLGGQENAFTSSDYTVYYQVVGKQHLAEVMKLEADRMHNLVIKNKEFQKEREVVTEERRWRIEDKPASNLYEQFNAIAFINSPPHHPTIGWMNDIRHYTAKDVRHWYRKWYAPNNATLVVVGDVDPQQVLKLAKRYYGVYKSKKIVQPKPQVEIPQQGERKVVLKGATKVPSVLMGFHVPTLATAKTPEEKQDVYALSVLSNVLDGDDSSRLTKDLVRGSKQLASAGAGYDELSRLETLFLMEGTPSKDVTPKQVEDALWQEIEKLQNTPIQPEELSRVLAQTEAQYVYHQDSIQAQAMVLGASISVGLPVDTDAHWIEHLRTVTPQQVQAVAKKYFSKDKMTLGVLLPNGKAPVQSESSAISAGGIR